MMNPNKLPHNLEAEASVLGGIILNASKLTVAEEHLAPDDFYSKKNQVIYENLISMREGGQAIDMVTLAGRLTNSGLLKEIGCRC